MRSRFGQCVIAFLLTAAFLWCFREVVVQRSLRRGREEVLAEEEYQRFQDYVEENRLDYRKIRYVCYETDTSEDTFLSDYLVMAAICALTIIPYSILLALIRRLADRFPDSNVASRQDQNPQEHPE